MMPKLNMAQDGRRDSARLPRIAACDGRNQLRKDLLTAIHELVEIQKQQTLAVINGDPEFARFDILLHMARERKEDAKYLYIAHVEAHHCEEA
jgi:hypothetical protein